MRYFLSTGEASGEASALMLAAAIRAVDPEARFEGIGGERMAAAGVRLWRDHTGWASMGPLAALPRIPKLLPIMWRTAAYIAASQPDLVVLVDFGVFNVRLAARLRERHAYAGPILYLFPPGTWLDNARRARAVGSLAVPLTAFAHQDAFYKGLGLPSAYFGHPLVAGYAMRAPRPAPPADAGTIAVLPGSRSGELRYHLPRLCAAIGRLRTVRPSARFVIGALDDRAEAQIRDALRRFRVEGVEIVRGAAAALAEADAAWVASGTAVLEAALTGVPTVALYVITPLLARHGRTMIKHGFITLPNLVLGRAVIPELLQEAATPERLCEELERALRDPSEQYRAFGELRTALGPADALERCARFAVALAQAGRR